MTDQHDREILITYWLEKADRAVASSARELQGGDLAFAVNRCYYACFYAFTAVLVRDGQFPRKHTMVRSFLNRDYVRPGIMPCRFGELYNRLFLDRQEGDYQPLVNFEREQVEQLLDGTRDFVCWCKGYLGLLPQ
ncbi:MAG TPA: HEPN domain-containing protein [Firmicutes bacterium]|nr:HEPN domain-containing protein [Bacillota bacterium]